MKNIKKMLSIGLAGILCGTTLSSVLANAFNPFDELEQSPEYNRIENVEEHDLLSALDHGEHSRFYSKSTDDNRLDFLVVSNAPSYITLTVPDDVNKEELEFIIAEECPTAIVSSYTMALRHEISYMIKSYAEAGSLSDEEHDAVNITLAQAKELYDVLADRDYVNSFDFYDCNYNYLEVFMDSLAEFIVDDDEKCRLEDYVTANEIDFSIIDMTEDAVLEAGKNFMGFEFNQPIEEAFDIMNKMHIDMEFPSLSWLVDGVSLSTFVDKTDMHNAVVGDANEDGILNMADAIYIMQFIANPDRFPLTVQGRFNADISDPGTGITAQDALVIQQTLLGLI